MTSRTEMKARMETYSCNINKNCKCRKRYCMLYNGPCNRTTDFKYARRTPINYIKRIINIIRGRE